MTHIPFFRHFTVAALGLAACVTPPAQAQLARIPAQLAIHPLDMTLQDQVNMLIQQLNQLKARLAADEAKLATTADTANSAKVAVNFTNSGITNQFNGLSAKVQGVSDNLAALQTTFQNHTHIYQRTKIVATTANGGSASLVTSNISVQTPTSPPQ